MKKLMLLFISMFFIGFTANAQWVQIGEDLDGEEGDRFGYSVSLSSDGNIVAIGGTINDENGPSSGVVRIYQNNNGIWTQMGIDIYGDAENDQFGNSVSLSSDGNTVAIGAWKSTTSNGAVSGRVSIYKFIDNIWGKVGQDILGGALGDESGTSVSLNSEGNIVAIGTPYNDDNGNSSGLVRIYQSNGSNWTQLGGDINGEGQLVALGYSVSLSSDGHTIATGALGTAGHVRIFHFNGVWTQVGENIEPETPNSGAGWSISLSSDGSIVAIGAALSNGDGFSGSGQVRVYQNIDDSWIQVGEDINGETTGDNSGWSVSLSSEGNIVAIGAPGYGASPVDAGQVRVFQNNSGVWTQVGDHIIGEGNNDKSASAVSLSSDGSIVAIGAKFNGDNGANAGHARVFAHGIDQISEMNLPNITLKPNPTTGKILIDLNATSQNLTINIYNAFGALMYTDRLSGVSSFEHILPESKGVYFVQLIIGEKNIRTFKIVKE